MNDMPAFIVAVTVVALSVQGLFSACQARTPISDTGAKPVARHADASVD